MTKRRPGVVGAALAAARRSQDVARAGGDEPRPYGAKTKANGH